MSAPGVQAPDATLFVVEDDDALGKAPCRMLDGAGFTNQDFAAGASFLATLKLHAARLRGNGSGHAGRHGHAGAGADAASWAAHRSILLTGSGSRSVEGRAKGFGAMRIGQACCGRALAWVRPAGAGSAATMCLQIFKSAMAGWASDRLMAFSVSSRRGSGVPRPLRSRRLAGAQAACRCGRLPSPAVIRVQAHRPIDLMNGRSLFADGRFSDHAPLTIDPPSSADHGQADGQGLHGLS